MPEEDVSPTKIKIKLTPEERAQLNLNKLSKGQEQQLPQQQQEAPQLQPQPSRIPEESLYGYAQQAALRTNARMMKTRQDLTPTIRSISRNHQSSQPYLNNSMHFQADNYPVLISDSFGRTVYNHNGSTTVSQGSLESFIKKNLNQQVNSYLSEVAGYNNFAIQNRRRRKHHFE